ncbi:MAG: hypothetical protein IKH96_12765 [Ruminococcus sp.]|uniref:DUF6583 family protein n=1 Tax=Ruminococcus sp. TaxID=41978 RepID=UPI0025D89FE5|nr:DUF6583 family protein [Ruminococcus sp.]MBR6996867.1 hypothetical protein [Ruminococcus sp.]
MFNNDQNNYENQSLNEEFSVSGVEPVTKKSKGKKAAVIGGISAAVLVGGSAAAYGLSDTVKNQVKLRVSSPEKYYAWVTEKNSKTIGETVSEAYKKGLDKYEKGQTVDFKVTFEPTDETKSLLKNELFGDYVDTENEELKSFMDIIDNNDKFSVSANCASKKGNIDADVSFGLNGERVAGADIVGDGGAADYFFRIPELKDQWLAIEYGKMLDDLVEEAGLDENPASAYKEILKDPESFLSPEDVETEVNKYAAVWSNFASDVEIEKKEEVDICDITVNYTVATVELTEKDAAKLEVEFLKELRDDKVVKDILTDKLDVVDKDEFESSIDDEIEDIKEDLKGDYYDDEEVVISIDTYIDGTGTIRGLKFYNDEGAFNAVMGKDGDSIRGEFSFTEDGEEQFSVKLTAEDNHKKYTGDIELTYSDVSYNYVDDDYQKEVTPVTVSVLFEDVEIVDEEKGYFNGDFTVNIPDTAPFVISCSADKDGQSVSSDIVIDGTNYGKLTFDYSVDYKADIDIPDKGGAFMIDPENSDDLRFEDYASQDEFSSFMKDILTKAGIDSKYADKYAGSITEAVYDELDYGSIDLDDDDFDFDDDFDDDDFDFDDEDLDLDDEDDYDDFEFSFNPDDFKYEDYKDFMTEDEFNEWMDEMKKYYDEYESSSTKAN